MITEKIGRNMLCPCGSGKKYKKCCLDCKKYEYVDDSDAEIEASEPQSSGLFKKLFARTKKKYLEGTADFINDEHGRAKMADVILDLAEKLLNAATSATEQENAIMIAVMSWNLSLIKKSKQHIKDFIIASWREKQLNPNEELLEVMMELIAKKQKIYPTINYFIVNYEFKPYENGFNLNIKSMRLP